MNDEWIAEREERVHKASDRGMLQVFRSGAQRSGTFLSPVSDHWTKNTSDLPYCMTLRRAEKNLFKTMRGTIESWQLLNPEDHVLVAISGGKDSYTMLDLLGKFQRATGSPGQLTAVHLDQGQPGYDGAPLEAWLRQSGFQCEIVREDTYSAVTSLTAEGDAFCTVCSRLRRGILYTAAERLGCNKVALGHHRDDALETFMLNLFFAGKLQAMPARYTTDDGKFEVIRPLIECSEEDIRVYAAGHAFPILPCNLCGSQESLQRDKMATLLRDFEKSSPNVRSIMMAALGNVRASHLLDHDIAELWAKRPHDMQPKVFSETKKRFAATGRRLPVVS